MSEASSAVLRQIDTATLQDRVYRELRRAIMAGVYAPGQTLSLNQISTALGTSIMPVRQALHRLAAERALEIFPKRGVQIPLITREKYEEIGRVRLQLEGMATEMAAARISEADLVKLEHLCAEMNKLIIEEGSWQNYVVRNYEFHFTVYRSGRPLVLLPLIESLWLQSGTLMSLYGQRGIQGKRGLHEAIIEALRSGDPAESRTAMQRDIQNGIEFIGSSTVLR